MLADVLTKLGFYAGKAEELLEPQVDNPKGFWERRDVVQLNDLILEEAGGSWWQANRKAWKPHAASISPPHLSCRAYQREGRSILPRVATAVFWCGPRGRDIRVW